MNKEEKVVKPDCYKCEFKRSVPGSCHSSCVHPKLKDVIGNSGVELMSILASVGRVPAVIVGAKQMGVTGNSYGIKMGWFNFPFNFDPTWLESCNGFKERI